jgi:hypothetical protein
MRRGRLILSTLSQNRVGFGIGWKVYGRECSAVDSVYMGAGYVVKPFGSKLRPGTHVFVGGLNPPQCYMVLTHGVR